MKYLLDSNILVWSMHNAERLPKNIHAIINDERHQLYVSIVSLWEVTIKSALGKLDVEPRWIERLEASDAKILPIDLAHIHRLKTLPPHHGDPFDRMLVAQAQNEALTIISADRHLQSYDVKIILA